MSFERDQEPPMGRPPLPPEPDEFRRPRPAAKRGGRSRALPIFIALFALGAFGGIVWYAYNQGMRSGASDVAPIIKAEEGPTKTRPDQPGGMQVPHQDKQVFQRLLPEGQAPQQVERLLPPAPEPMQAPTPPPVAAAPQAVLPPATGPAITPAPTSPVTPAPSSQLPGTTAPQPLTPPQTAQIPPAVSEPAPAPQAGQPSVPPSAPAPQPPSAAAPAPSTAAPAATPAPAPSTSATTAPVSGGRFKVQLGAVRSADAATQEWNRLRARYKAELGSLTVSTQTVEVAGKGTYHRVQAGPLDEAGASRVCDALKAQKQACIVVRP